MSATRRALLWALLVALLTTIALMVSGEPRAQIDVGPSPITTPSTTQPVIAHIEETS